MAINLASWADGQIRSVSRQVSATDSRPLIIGLTGGIGSGKSAAADAFATCGARIVDTDVIAHALTAPGGLAMPAIAQAFGPTVVAETGALDRVAMRALAFADPACRSQLEGILHPLIRQESDRQVVQALSDVATPYVVLVVPLLVESGSYAKRVDRVCVVDCPEAAQIERVMRRSGLSEEQVSDIMAAQTSRSMRLAAANDVIDNTSGLDQLTTQVRELDRRYRSIRGEKAGNGAK
jgi:dephospho-CoA kinase